MRWPWTRRRRIVMAEEVEAAFWQGVAAARREDIMAVEAMMATLPEYAKNSFKHLAFIIAALRKLPLGPKAQPGGTDGEGQSAGAGEARADARGTEGAEAGRGQVAPPGDRGRGGAQVLPGRGLQRPHQGAPEAAARTQL